MHDGDLAKVKQFADTVCPGNLERFRRKLDDDIAQLRASSAARGVFMSGGRILQESRLWGEFVSSCVRARANALIEGCQLHKVDIDSRIADAIINDVSTMRQQMVEGAKTTLAQSSRMGGIPSAGHEIDTESSMAISEVRATLARAKLVKVSEPTSTVTNVYHVYGHNPHVNVNSTDNSINSVTMSHQELFTKLREEISQNVADEQQQALILSKLSELEQSANTKSFAERFTDFVAVSANIMTIVGPFIPALSEMMRQGLK